MNTNIKEIKEKYPHPVSAYDPLKQTDSYCVLGAFCLENGNDLPFPSPIGFLQYVFGVNYNAIYRALHRAKISAIEEIMRENDEGNFDKAWELLDKLCKRYKKTLERENNAT